MVLNKMATSLSKTIPAKTFEQKESVSSVFRVPTVIFLYKNILKMSGLSRLSRVVCNNKLNLCKT